MRRRTFLVGVGAASIAGCVESTGDEFDPAVESRYRRGAAPSVELEFEPHEPTEDLTADDHAYLESQRVVHINYGNSFGGMDFEEFGRTRSRSAVRRDLRRRFEQADSDDLRTSVSTASDRHGQRLRRSDLDIDLEAYDVVILVSHLTVFDSDGNLLSEPEVDFDTLVELVPGTYETQTTFGGYEYTASIAAVCYRGAEQIWRG